MVEGGGGVGKKGWGLRFIPTRMSCEFWAERNGCFVGMGKPQQLKRFCDLAEWVCNIVFYHASQCLLLGWLLPR